jgi:hypothetical protein
MRVTEKVYSVRMAAGMAAWIAHVAFWTLLAIGWAFGDLDVRRIVVFLALWVTGYIGLSYVASGGDLFFSYVAILDVVLVFIIFKGDIRLT